MRDPRDVWKERLEALFAQVKNWVEPHDWVTRTYPKRMREFDQSVFEVSALVLQRGPMRLILDPVAYDAPGCDGVVDLYLMPTYDDMAVLILVDGVWQIEYDFSQAPGAQRNEDPIGVELTETSLNRVLDEIAAHAVPSF